tara:strand:- start:2687 stop:3772 length:1086 start_codon:yes stop_codon:yes gene_type:complete
MINFSYFLTLIGINQSFYTIKYGVFIILGILYFKYLNNRINIIFILIIIFGLVIQNDHTAIFNTPKLNNLHAHVLFEMLLFPYLLCQISYNLSLSKKLDLTFIARAYIIITIIFITLQLTIPSIGYFFYQHNILEYPRLYRNINMHGIDKANVYPGITSSEFYMSSYISLLLPIALGKRIINSLYFSFNYIVRFFIPIAILSGVRTLILGLIVSQTRIILFLIILGFLPFILIILKNSQIINLDFLPFTFGDQERYIFFIGGIEIIKEYPLGLTELKIFAEEFFSWPHNFLVTLSLIYGLDFIIVLIYFFYVLFKLEKYIILAIMAAFIASLYHNMAPFFLFWPFWVVFGYGLGELNNQKK